MRIRKTMQKNEILQYLTNRISQLESEGKTEVANELREILRMLIENGVRNQLKQMMWVTLRDEI